MQLMNAVDEYVDVIFQQTLAEQKQSFCCGVCIGMGLVREMRLLFKKGEK